MDACYFRARDSRFDIFSLARAITEKLQLETLEMREVGTLELLKTIHFEGPVVWHGAKDIREGLNRICRQKKEQLELEQLIPN